MASLLRAQAEEADSVASKAEGDLPTKGQPSGKRGDRADQPDPTGLGELFLPSATRVAAFRMFETG